MSRHAILPVEIFSRVIDGADSSSHGSCLVAILRGPICYFFIQRFSCVDIHAEWCLKPRRWMIACRKNDESRYWRLSSSSISSRRAILPRTPSPLLPKRACFNPSTILRAFSILSVAWFRLTAYPSPPRARRGIFPIFISPHSLRAYHRRYALLPRCARGAEDAQSPRALNTYELCSPPAFGNGHRRALRAQFSPVTSARALKRIAQYMIDKQDEELAAEVERKRLEMSFEYDMLSSLSFRHLMPIHRASRHTIYF